MSRLPLDSWVVIPSPPGGIQIYIGRLHLGFQPLVFLCTTFGKQGTPIVCLALKNGAPIKYLLTESLLYVK